MFVTTRAGRNVLISLGLVWGLSAPGAAFAQPASDVPRAREVVRSMADFLHGTRNLSFHMELSYDQIADWGQKIELAGASDVWLSRPNRMYVDFRDDVAARKFWYDGETVTLLDPHSGLYAEAPAPPTLDAMVDELGSELDVRLPVAQLLTAGPFAAIEERIQDAYYLGLHDADGVACHHVALVADTVDIQFWIELGNRPVPRKIVVDYREVPGVPRYEAALMDWGFAAPEASVFVPKLPEDAARIDFLGLKREGAR